MFMNGKWEWVIIVISGHDWYFLFILNYFSLIYQKWSKSAYRNIVCSHLCAVIIICSSLCKIYLILSSIVHTFLHRKWCRNIPWNAWNVAEKGFKIAFMMNKLAMIILFEFFLEKNNFFCQKSLWNSGAHYTCMHYILDKIQYIIHSY